MAVFHQNVVLPFCFVLQIPQTTVDTIINQENDPCFDSRHQTQHNGFTYRKLKNQSIPLSTPYAT